MSSQDPLNQQIMVTIHTTSLLQPIHYSTVLPNLFALMAHKFTFSGYKRASTKNQACHNIVILITIIVVIRNVIISF